MTEVQILKANSSIGSQNPRSKNLL